jgi:hypothetical protein
MARSLSVKHEEKPATSSLFNFFLVLAFAWMGLAAAASSFASNAQSTAKTTVVPAD